MRPYTETLFLLVLVGLLCLLIGLIWFGMLNLRKPVLISLAVAAVGDRDHGLCWLYPLQRRGDRSHLLIPHAVCPRPDGLGLILWLEKPVQPEVKGDALTLQVSDA